MLYYLQDFPNDLNSDLSEKYQLEQCQQFKIMGPMRIKKSYPYHKTDIFYEGPFWQHQENVVAKDMQCLSFQGRDGSSQIL